MSAGSNIRAHRFAAGLTLRRAAALAKMDPAALSRIENGKSEPTIGSLRKISRALGAQPSDLLEAPMPGTRNVPATAFHFFNSGSAKLAAGSPSKAKSKTGAIVAKYPVHLLARSAQPIHHPWWGRVVHDMAGLALPKNRIPLDWCHQDNVGSQLGYLDHFDPDGSGGLVVAGKLISASPDDAVADLVRKSSAGIPFQASIDFSGPATIEEVSAGEKSAVNGSVFAGPGVIVREWTLRSVAICPSGADPDTSARFAAGAAPQTVAVMTPSQASDSRRRSRLVAAMGETMGRVAAGMKFPK